MANGFTVENQMKDILEDYSKEVRRATANSQDKVAKEAVRKLKNTSPKKSGKYAKGWTLKRERSTTGVPTVTIHNKVYRLTHLLENGHVVRNAKGTYGRTNGIKHIKPVEEWASSELPLEIERELNK